MNGIQHRNFIVKAGMTVEDVKNAKGATQLQKKYAYAFDTDGKKGFSQKEADLFNATTFSEKSDGSVIFWTRQKDGTKQSTKFKTKNNIKYTFSNNVKPYVVTKKIIKHNITDNGVLDNGFYAVAGIPVKEIERDEQATNCQRQYAKVFDANYNGILEQDEADIFNATTFTKKPDNTVEFRTRIEKHHTFRRNEKLNIVHVFTNKEIANAKIDLDLNRLEEINAPIAPYAKTHYEIDEWGADIGGVNFDTRVKDYAAVYHNGQYMNSVTMSEDGTKIIFPDQNGGKVRTVNQGGTDISYTWGGGVSVSEGTYSPAGNPGWKRSSSPNNYYSTFENINNATIVGTNGSDRYQLENCNNCVVDNSKHDNTQDKVFIVDCSNVSVLQNSEDATRMKMKNYDIQIDGNKKINSTNLQNDCSSVKMKSHIFKENEFIGVKNYQIKYDENQTKSIGHWYQ